VNLYVACSQLNLYATHLWVNLYAVHSQLNLCATYPQVDLHVTHQWVNQCASYQWVNNKMILPVCVGCTIYHNLRDHMFQFGGIQQHSIILWIIHFLCLIQSLLTVQILVKLSKCMHINFNSTRLFVSLSLYFISLIIGVVCIKTCMYVGQF
jgi:hypothetical protein